MPTYPLSVEVNEKNLMAVTDIFKSAYKEIVDEIAGATNFGTYNRKAILSQIEKILTDLGIDVDEFIKEELPKYYKQGADQAIKQLLHVGAEIKRAEGFNRIHRLAIVALVDETATAFGESISGVNRSAQHLLGKAVKDQITQEIALGKIKGEALKTVTNNIKALLKEEGLDALVDKAGRGWTLDRYAEMLVRTKAVEARNRGLMNRMVENDYDLVQVSDHGTDHEACAVWESKVLSVTGLTPGYKTVEEARQAGLFHPNCQHAINALVPDLAERTKAYDPDREDYFTS